jgi:hypothetical protein
MGAGAGIAAASASVRVRPAPPGGEAAVVPAANGLSGAAAAPETAAVDPAANGSANEAGAGTEAVDTGHGCPAPGAGFANGSPNGAATAETAWTPNGLPFVLLACDDAAGKSVKGLLVLAEFGAGAVPPVAADCGRGASQQAHLALAMSLYA